MSGDSSVDTAGPVAVTGAGGKLGTGVVERLRRDRAVRPTVQDTAQAGAVGTDAVVVDVTDFEATVDALRGASAVVHLAAIPAPTLVGSFMAYPSTYIGGVNVAGGDFWGRGTTDVVTAPHAFYGS